MNIVVTGGNGFIGKPTVAALKRLGATVRTTSRSTIPITDTTSIRLDIADSSTWKNLLRPEPPNRLIHLAWDLLDNFEDPRHYREQNQQHLEFLLWCIDLGITDITMAGSCLEYGLREGLLKEDTPAEPVTAYAIAKDNLRRSLEHYAQTKPFVLKWARIFFVRGDEEQEKGVFEHVRKAALAGKPSVGLTWGEQLRDYLPRAEVGSFLAQFCLQDTVCGIVNCCSGIPLSIRTIVEEYAHHWPVLKLDFGKTAYRHYEPMAIWGDRSRMKTVIGYSPAQLTADSCKEHIDVDR